MAGSEGLQLTDQEKQFELFNQHYLGPNGEPRQFTGSDEDVEAAYAMLSIVEGSFFARLEAAGLSDAEIETARTAATPAFEGIERFIVEGLGHDVDHERVTSRVRAWDKIDPALAPSGTFTDDAVAGEVDNDNRGD